ncbi:acyl-CoA dehydrogenase family protein [Microbulbifer sp.]|uniref:acyl-CoA dehydrogenase family protein n=1 Tax=Microbulbifer sp. TaxID=1908541 RepID=UPI00258E33C5|nr:acyl-CoA dehydrogenase family protein [Microbulbifer sp.]
MNPISQSQRELVERARLFVKKELLPLEAGLETERGLSLGVSNTIVEKARVAGLFAGNIGKQFGGQGFSTVENILLQEQLGATKEILARRAGGNVYECLASGSGEQIERYLLPSVRGERFCGLAVSEPEAGSDAAAIRTRVEKTTNGWRLSGTKHFTSDAEFCDFFIVAAVTEPGLGARGISLFLVDRDLPGFELGKTFHMMGFRGTSHRELLFHDIELPPGALLGELNNGFRMLGDTLGKARLAKVGARAVGKCQRLLHLMKQHATNRRQFGKTIGEFGPVRQMIADSAIEIAAARALLMQTAVNIDAAAGATDRAIRADISAVKVFTTETLGRVADRALQIFGGSGCHEDSLVESFYRDARLYRIIDGTSEIHRDIVAQNVYKSGLPCPVAFQ